MNRKEKEKKLQQRAHFPLLLSMLPSNKRKDRHRVRNTYTLKKLPLASRRDFWPRTCMEA